MEKEEKFKYSIILNKEKYKKINDKISTLFKDYFSLMNKYSYEINYIEQIVNSYIPKKNFNIKKFIENQQLLIKDLVNIINNALSEIRIYSNKNNSKKKQSIKTIIRRNNSNINYLENLSKTSNRNNSYDINTNINNQNNILRKNKSNNNIYKSEKIINLNIESNNQFNGDLSFLNIKIPHKRYKRNKQSKQNIEDIDYKNNNRNDISRSSMTTNIFSTKNKSYINNSYSNLSNNEINITNNNNKNNLSNSHKINITRSISSYNNKIEIKKKKSNKKFNFSEKNIIFNSKSFSTKINDKYKYTNKSSITNKSNEVKKYYLTFNNNIKNNNSKTPPKILENKNSDNKIYIPSFIFNDSISEDFIINQEKYKKICNMIKDKKINNIKKYEVIQQFKITPNRLTKEMLNISYSKLNKYEQKRKKNTSLGKRSKSLLI